MIPRKPPAVRISGFALIACVLLLMLVSLAAVGMTRLATLQLRISEPGLRQAEARANARMALTLAIGQLQRTLGPDRRVSAQADITGDNLSQPFWTGAWKSSPDDGGDWLTRDDLRGGLRDRRQDGASAPGVMEWLISGKNEKPSTGPARERVELVSKEKTGGNSIEVSLVEIADAAKKPLGRYGWWTGDLGIRANISVPDAHRDAPILPASPEADAYARVLSSQRVEEKLMAGGEDVPTSQRLLLGSDATTRLATRKATWTSEHFLDFTTFSSGVLSDLNHGGLKRDLTAYFESDGVIPAQDGLPGISDDDLLAGAEPEKETGQRMQQTAPRFGLLRQWARSSQPFSGNPVPQTNPDVAATTDAKESADRALSNEQSVKLYGDRRPSLRPVLVEATNYTQISTYNIADPSAEAMYQMRTLLYPRVVLWNPYNLTLHSERSIIVIQGNGRQEMWTLNASGRSLQWLSFEGGRSTGFVAGDDIMSAPSYEDPYIGSYYFSLPATTFAPGECLVFSPARSAEYNGLSAYRPGPYDLSANELSCEVSPDPSRTYYVSSSSIGEGTLSPQLFFWYAPTPFWSSAGRSGVENQGDDSRAILKLLPAGNAAVTFESFDKLPQLCVLSASLQYGAGKEPRVAWSKYERMPVEILSMTSPRPTVIPNVRTRESIRMRWFEEHPSNLLASGRLANTAHFEEAMLATWNPRASYIVRSPWENIAGTLPTSGFGGGPWFFGAYTRDLYDQAVSWEDMAPVPKNGVYLGSPFGQPQEGKNRIVVFDVPRNETGVMSLGQLQHANLSEFVWAPSFIAGNSLADPRLGDHLDRTAAYADSADEDRRSGFQKNAIGWSTDQQRSGTQTEWADNATAMLQRTPETDNLVVDLSYEVNRTLWDRYYFSTGSPADKEAFLKNPLASPLPNGRLRLAPGHRPQASDLTDFHQSASHLMVEGAFNVNSTRVEAWKAFLASTRSSGFSTVEGTPFPRVLNPPGGAWTSDDSAEDENAWTGYRVLTDAEIETLATEIIAQVKKRGPFLSMADFVNRSLERGDHGKAGVLQTAIDLAGINRPFEAAYPLDNTRSLPDYRHPDHILDATRLEQSLKPATKAWGIPGFLTQADVLQALGPAMAARSDTFVIRAYGDSLATDGRILARAWCEAVVQRTPWPLKADASGINPANPETDRDWGRRFELVAFRWLRKDEL